MISFPNAKINLGLDIIKKRADGYHEISSCFYPIPLHDVLEFIPAEISRFQSTGLPIPGDIESNLVWKAYQLLKQDFQLPEIDTLLHKIIPMGAGIGGGSADASFMLNMLNEKFGLNCSIQQLENYALQLGSDCPFFIENTPKYVTGRGEHFAPINISLEGYYLGLIFPGLHIGTKEAYSAVTPEAPRQSVKQIIEDHPIEEWRHYLKNDFEQSAFQLYPALKKEKEKLYDAGAVYASMTGSGSTLYGIFKKEPDQHIVNKILEL